jgi:endogenous inhibitor of DNA gyrase (YacG/DUF329 family)
MIKARCPICNQEMPGHTSDWPDYPFCSPRCRKIDLGRWLGEKYRIPDAGTAKEDESSDAPAPDEHDS